MHKLAEYVLRGRRQAIFAALIATFLPLLSWVGIVIMAFVTLRKGAKEGFIVLLWILLPCLLYPYWGLPTLLTLLAFGGAVMVWLQTVVLLKTRSWALLFEVSALLGLLCVAVVHLFVPDIGAYWLAHTVGYLQAINKEAGGAMTPAMMSAESQFVAKFATGLQVAGVIANAAFNLALARWWQATVMNPGGLRKELYGIRLGKMSVVILLLSLVAAVLHVGLAYDLLPVVVLPFLVAAMSLVHHFVARTRFSWAVILPFYALFFVLFQLMIGVLVAVALADSYFDFRRRISLPSDKLTN